MANTFKVPAKSVRWLTDQAFPGYKKRHATIEVTTKVYFNNTFWDGGSKNTYKAVKLDSGEVASLLVGSSPWNAVAEGTTVELTPGVAIVEQSCFLGKDMPLRIHLHPDNLSEKMLASKSE